MLVHAWESRENYFRDGQASVDDDVVVEVLHDAGIRNGMELDGLLLRAQEDVDRNQARGVGNHVAAGALEGEAYCVTRKLTGRVAGDERQLMVLVAILRAEGLSGPKRMTNLNHLCFEFRPSFSDVLARKVSVFLLHDKMMN